MRYGPIMMDIEGLTPSPQELSLLSHPNLGGILLFSRNYKNINDLKKLIQTLRTKAQQPLLIAVDHEGGRIWRFHEGFTHIPAAREFGQHYAQNSQEALASVKAAGKRMATELVQCGIDLSLAPVLDLDKNQSEIIGDRSYSSDPEVVSLLAQQFILGMKEAGMAATGKHFPGHGHVAKDTHVDQVFDTRKLEEIVKADLIPFQKLSKELGAIMPAHIIFPEVDNVPVGYSKRWLQDILRTQLEFTGAILSDCLSMMGACLGGDLVVRARLALEAGCDMVIISQQSRDKMAWVLDRLEYTTHQRSQSRLAALAYQDRKLQPLEA